jgi:hypothetical protein
MALFMHQQFTLYTFEALTTQTPDAVLAEGTKRSLK